MFNSGIGPVITKKLSKMNPQQKKPMPSGAMAMMYSSQMMNQNKMGMPPNMGMPTNPMNAMKDPNMLMQQQQQMQQQPHMNPNQPQHPSSMKIENVSLQTAANKGGTHFMVNKGTISSPSPIQTQGTPKDLDPRSQIPNSPALNIAMQQQIGNLNPMNVTATAAMTMKPAEKEPQKTFELMTLTLKIGNNKFNKDCKITTKFIPSKKQIIFEIVDVGSPTKGADEETKGGNKRRFETKFSDIDKVDVITADNLVKIETRERPTEFKEQSSSQKKTSQWVKESTYETESEVGGDDESKSGITVITAKFKDNLTKTAPGKMSHLDKLKRCEFSLYVDGKIVENPPTPMKIALPFGGAMERNDSLPPLNLPPNLHSSSGFGGQKKEMGILDLNLQSQNSLSMSRRESMAMPMDLNPYPKEVGTGDKIQEEEPPQEPEEDDEDKEFPPLTKEKKLEVKKFEAQLKSMKEDDKVSLIMETIKPKRFGINPNSKKIFKCPVYKCNFNKPSVALLKSHLTQKHHKILEMGFKMDESGSFSWKPELVDFSLMVAKIYPKFVKNIIKEAKKGS